MSTNVLSSVYQK